MPMPRRSWRDYGGASPFACAPMDSDGSRFERPRIYAAGALVVTACLLLLLDMASPDHRVDAVTIGTLLVIAGALLGVEVNDVVRRR